ncbi:MAG: hypothetical protein PHY16_17795 [Methylobacter sp.]|nr:hypothetical protein [Methylobacter sp.]
MELPADFRLEKVAGLNWNWRLFSLEYAGVEMTLRVRGGKAIKATVSSAQLKAHAHGKKRLVVALKYEEESDYRYLVATDMTWRTMDTIQAYTLRWLVEVSFEDWKL